MDYFKINREAWDKRAQVHIQSEFYNVDGFLAGSCSLNDIELAALGDVQGKELLHLQCHFGLDTLSWARKGAIVTGVDLSPVAIEKANELKSKAELDADFICSDVYAYGLRTKPRFDIVFTSYGVVCWLPDLDKWARTISNSLRMGGTFFMAEFHPIYDLLTGYSYFHNDTPDVEESGTYTENCDGVKSKLAMWGHPLSDVVNALIRAGIAIEHLHEFPYSPYNCFEGLEERESGRFYLTKTDHDAPLIYSIKGIKTR